MKAWTMVCAFAALALSTAAAQDAKPADCDLIKIFSLVKPLESDPNVKKCSADAGFELLPPPGTPTKEQTAKLCGSDSCKAVFATLQKLDIPDCSISILGGVNMKKVINEAFGQCSATASTKAPASASPSPAPATAATPTPTPSMTPAMTSAKPAAGATPTPGATTAAPSAPTPAPASKAPAPAPTPAASNTKATGKTKRCEA
jgi:hypothetical protein